MKIRTDQERHLKSFVIVYERNTNPLTDANTLNLGFIIFFNLTSLQGSEKKSTKEKKKGRGILKHGENKSFIPLFREPSSIEKILGEADQQKLFVRPQASSELSITPAALPLRPTSPRVASPRAPSPRAASPRAVSPKVASPRASSQRVVSPRAPAPRAASPGTASPAVAQNRREINYVSRPEPTLRNQHLSATKIQAAYRGYMVSFQLYQIREVVVSVFTDLNSYLKKSWRNRHITASSISGYAHRDI